MAEKDIIAEYLRGLRAIQRLVDRTISAVRLKAHGGTNWLEDEMEFLIASFRDINTKFFSQLTTLYAKQSKPHPVSLDLLVGKLERELRAELGKIQDKLHELKDLVEARAVDSVDPLLFVELLGLASYEELIEEYKKYAKDNTAKGGLPSPRLIKAFKRVVESRGKD